MDEADALEALANTLTLLTDDAYNIALHAQHVRLARASGMDEQQEVALEMVTSFWAAGDYVWIPLIDLRAKSVDMDLADSVQTVVELFERAEEDYLCMSRVCVLASIFSCGYNTAIPLLKKHLEFVIERHRYFVEEGTIPEELGDLFTTEWTLKEMEKVASRGAGHLTEVCCEQCPNRHIITRTTEPPIVGPSARTYRGDAGGRTHIRRRQVSDELPSFPHLNKYVP